MRYLPEVELRNKKILIISPEFWGDNHLSKHHYAIELAANGNQVYYLNPPSQETNITRISDSLIVINYVDRFKGKNRLPNWIRVPIMQWIWSALEKRIGAPIDIVWSFDPYRFQDLDKLGNVSYTIFHSVDLPSTTWDIYVARKAKLVLTTSNVLLDRYGGPAATKYCIGHGLSANFVTKGHAQDSFQPDPDHIAIGYCGNLLIKYLDRKTLLEIVRDHPEKRFYFIGPYDRSNLSWEVDADAFDFIEALKGMPNCQLVGQVPPLQLPAYLDQMDILLVCYESKQFKLEVAAPHKVLEYLSTGKVMVSSELKEYRSRDDLIEMTANNGNLSKLLGQVADKLDFYNSADRMNKRISFAREHTYRRKIKEIEHIISDQHNN